MIWCPIAFVFCRQGNKKVEAVALEYKHSCDFFAEKEFRGLSNLRFLQLGNAEIKGNFGKHLPNLMWLEWQGCSIGSTTLWNLNLEKLVILDMSGRHVTEHWKGWKWIMKVFESFPLFYGFTTFDIKDIEN